MHDGKLWLHRKILDSDLWAMPFSHIIVALVCLLKANWEDRVIRGMVVKRGQWLTHLKDIRELCPPQMTFKMIRTATSNLTQSGFLGIRSVTMSGIRFLLITVCKYEEYQAPMRSKGTTLGTRSGTGRAHGGHTEGTTLTEGSKEIKEIKNKDNTLVDPDEFALAWNSIVREPMIRKMGNTYCRELRRLAQDSDFRANWKEAVVRCRRGGYTVSVSWFLRGDANWQRSLEGVPRRKEAERDPVLMEIDADRKRVELERGEA